jgi:hypothetical protein
MPYRGPSADPTLAAPPRTGIHPAWWVAAVAFVALLGAAGFRAAPGVLMVPLQEQFGWSRTVMSAAVSSTPAQQVFRPPPTKPTPASARGRIAQFIKYGLVLGPAVLGFRAVRRPRLMAVVRRSRIWAASAAVRSSRTSAISTGLP